MNLPSCKARLVRNFVGLFEKVCQFLYSHKLQDIRSLSSGFYISFKLSVIFRRVVFTLKKICLNILIIFFDTFSMDCNMEFTPSLIGKLGQLSNMQSLHFSFLYDSKIGKPRKRTQDPLYFCPTFTSIFCMQELKLQRSQY